jgi:SsrA-binding protein
MIKKKKASNTGGTIALNKKARHDFFIETKFEAGVELAGWEVKALREGKCQLVESYVLVHKGQAELIGVLISPTQESCSYVVTEPRRPRRLLLHKREIEKISQNINAKGYTCVCTAIYWKGHRVKAEIALAKGKQQHDKRHADKDKDWAKQKERTMKHAAR